MVARPCEDNLFVEVRINEVEGGLFVQLGLPLKVSLDDVDGVQFRQATVGSIDVEVRLPQVVEVTRETESGRGSAGG